MGKQYCRPLNAGLASEPAAVRRRLGRLLTAVDEQVNGFIVDGPILDDIRAFRDRVTDGSKAQGWTWSYCGTNCIRFRPPGHKRPYTHATP